jgi:hypothetical protein
MVGFDNKRFTKVVEALASLKGDFVLDGELVAIASAKQSVADAPSLFLRLRSAKPR